MKKQKEKSRKKGEAKGFTYPATCFGSFLLEESIFSLSITSTSTWGCAKAAVLTQGRAR